MGMSKKQKRLLQTAAMCVSIAGKNSIGAKICQQEIRKIDKRKREQFRAARKEKR